MIETLRNGNFARLWGGGLISLIGDWVLIVGLPIYVYLLSGSVLATSGMLLAARFPSVAFGSIAGIFVDRWDRQWTLVVGNLLLALGLVPLLLVTGPERIGIVYVVAFFEASVAQFCGPAQSAFLPAVVDEDHLVPANSLNSLSSSLGRLIGPAIGGIVGAWFGLGGIALTDAVSFLVPAALITSIVLPNRAVSSRLAAIDDVSIIRRVGREWAEGLRLIARERVLLTVVGVLTITALGEGVFGVLYPVFVNQVLHGAALQVGELMSAQAVGGIAGGILVGWVGKRIMAPGTIGLCTVSFGLLDLAIFNVPAVVPGVNVEVVLFVAVGIPGIAALTGLQSLLQARSPDAYRGRVFGTLGMTMGLLGLLGTLIAGTVTDHLGVVSVLTIQGAGYVLAGILVLALLPWAASDASASASTTVTEDVRPA